MTIADGFMLFVRWGHAIASVVWLGGILFYVLVLQPFRNNGQERFTGIGADHLKEFRGIVDTCIIVLIVTGTILLFGRLTEPSTSNTYIVTIGVKIILSMLMFAIARRKWGTRSSNKIVQEGKQWVRSSFITKRIGMTSGVYLTLVLGLTVFFLSDLLAYLFEQGLTHR